MTTEKPMTSLAFTTKELTYLIVATKRFRENLHASIHEEMGDEYDDILMADHLIKRLAEAVKDAETPDIKSAP